MNSKYLLQFIVYLLFGVMAMADPGMRTHWHAGDLRSYATSSAGDNFVADHDEEVNTTYSARKRQSFLRIRFRCETSFRSSHTNLGKLVNTAVHLPVSVLYTRKIPHLPPFYYVFLFRLTPF
ncbi:MAG TPA: hypothetical protein VIM79_07270 [Niastella sp.]